ncbi:MAG: MBL fold metallo-hydrolase [Candidatus Latescibacterota bacterium]|nr:MBL fold metallo-hydrolase [Candidatus Latescibacterota bacterium]
MKIRFWGVRGSFPVSSPHAVRHGGNTPCVEVDTEGRIILIDAGTGIRGAGQSLLERGVTSIDLLLSHAHWDHIQGLPHCDLLAQDSVHLTIHALRQDVAGVGKICADRSLQQLFVGQQTAPFFPVPLTDARAHLEFVEHEEGETFAIGKAQITCRRLNHPGVAGGFRIEGDSHAFAYISDTDLFGELLLANLPAANDAERKRWHGQLQQGAHDLGHRADLMVCDTFFLPEEYQEEWGHSRPDDFIQLANSVGAHRLFLFHHRPGRKDEELDAIVERYQGRVNGNLEIIAAREGQEVALY